MNKTFFELMFHGMFIVNGVFYQTGGASTFFVTGGLFLMLADIAFLLGR